MKGERGEMIVVRKSPLNAEAPLRSLRSSITPEPAFFIRCHFDIPRVKLSSWRLKVDGDVKDPREFAYEDLLELPIKTVAATMECAGNGRTGFEKPAEGEVRWGSGALGTASWSGVSLKRVLAACGIEPTATEVVAHGADSGEVKGVSGSVRYARGLPVEKAMDEDTIIALKMNGKRLSPEHGYPARLLVPGWYGMASVKWLQSLTLGSGRPFHGFFNGVKYVYVEESGGGETATPVRELRVKSLITHPADGETVQVGRRVKVAGRAWSGAARIALVEVNFGNGWERAELHGAPRGRYEWVEWARDWTPKRRGTAVLMARATDEKGNVQPLEPQENRFQYGYNAAAKVRLVVG